MKRTHISFFALIILVSTTGINSYAQDISTYISDARASYLDQNYNEARQNLQNALIELDKSIATEIIALLPDKLDNLEADKSLDNVNNNSGIAGLFVSRLYGTKEGKYAEFTIVDNSPMVSVISAFFSSPLLSGISAANGGQKVVKINNYKSMIQQEEDSEVVTIMIPFGDTLVTLESNNGDEAEIISLAELLPLNKIEESVY